MTRDQSLHILQHSLGLDDYGRGKPYRNHYVAGDGCDSWGLLMAHVSAGRMVRHEPREIFGGHDHYCFTVTDVGREYVRANSPAPPKTTRAQKRYQQFLESGGDLRFGEWLKQEYSR